MSVEEKLSRDMRWDFMKAAFVWAQACCTHSVCTSLISFGLSSSASSDLNLCGACSSCSSQSPHRTKTNKNTHLTPAEKLTTGKKSPSVLKFSNMPWTGCPLILKEMLGAPRSRQQLTTSSEVRMCWLRDATARGIRPVWPAHTHTHTVLWKMIQWVMLAQIMSLSLSHAHSHIHAWTHTFVHANAHSNTHSGQGDGPAGNQFCLDTTWPQPRITTHLEYFSLSRYGPSFTWKLFLPLTWPEVESVKSKWVEVISDSIATPSLASTGVGGVAFRVGPSHPQMRGLAGHKVVHLVDHQLIVPLLILSRTLAHP